VFAFQRARNPLDKNRRSYSTTEAKPVRVSTDVKPSCRFCVWGMEAQRVRRERIVVVNET
jgi:hypothetical protein